MNFRTVFFALLNVLNLKSLLCWLETNVPVSGLGEMHYRYPILTDSELLIDQSRDVDLEASCYTCTSFLLI